MFFFEKLKTDLPKEELAENEVASSTKRKRGRPKKSFILKENAGPESTASKENNKHLKEPLTQKDFGELTIDVYETEKELMVISPVAGIKPENLDISIEDDMLIIKGERQIPPNVEHKKTIVQECYWGPFLKRLVLPFEVKESEITASLERGILIIRLPKAMKDKKRKISIEEIEE